MKAPVTSTCKDCGHQWRVELDGIAPGARLDLEALGECPECGGAPTSPTLNVADFPKG